MNNNSNPISQVLGAMAGQPEPSQQAPTQEPEQEQLAQDIEGEKEPVLGVSEPESEPLPNSESEPEPEAEPQEGQSEGVNLRALADELQIDIKDLYKVQVGIGGGNEPITLGELKDSYKELQDLGHKRDELDKNTLERENEFLRARQELSAIVSQLPQLPEGYQQAIAEQQRGIMQKEQQALLQAIPEMADQTQAQVVNKRVFDIGQEYGYSPVELGYIQDHRIIKMVNDFAKLRERIASADANSKKVTRATKTPAKTSKASINQINKTKQQHSKVKPGDRQAQTSALVKVLAGG